MSCIDGSFAFPFILHVTKGGVDQNFAFYLATMINYFLSFHG